MGARRRPTRTQQPRPAAAAAPPAGAHRAAPHGQARYTSVGYLILGEVISAAAGTPLETYVRQAVLEPSGMHRTGYAYYSDQDTATGYVRAPRALDPVLDRPLALGVPGGRDGGLRSLHPFYVDGPAYGGLVGDVRDAARFLRLHLNDGALDGQRVLSTAAARQMRRITYAGRPNPAASTTADRRGRPSSAEHIPPAGPHTGGLGNRPAAAARRPQAICNGGARGSSAAGHRDRRDTQEPSMHTTRLVATSTAVIAAACAALFASTPAVAGSGIVEGPVIAFADPYGDGRPNPAEGATARVHAVVTGTDRSIVTLHVKGLVPERGYGAHVHVGTCADNKGGGHYMHDPAAGATSHNEVWLDMVANAAGRGRAQAVVGWTFRAGEANSVVLHDRVTDAAGTAGPKLACLDVAF